MPRPTADIEIHRVTIRGPPDVTEVSSGYIQRSSVALQMWVWHPHWVKSKLMDKEDPLELNSLPEDGVTATNLEVLKEKVRIETNSCKTYQR